MQAVFGLLHKPASGSMRAMNPPPGSLVAGFAMCMAVHLMAQETPFSVTVTIQNKITARIDDRLFGQFLERPSGGERGPESVVDQATGSLPQPVMDLSPKMAIPVIRFPGGTDVDYMDWRDMVSNVPGRAAERPVSTGNNGKTVTNRFGFDEYFALRDKLHCQTILVVNFLDAVAKKRPLEEAALNAAGLVAYANAPAGAQLPAGMPDWPAVRAKNGHPAPFGIEYIQIGNEVWIEKFRTAVKGGTAITDPQKMAEWWLQCYRSYIGAIRKVDSKIPIIIDGNMGDGVEKSVLADPYIRQNVQYVTLHKYAPGATDKLTRDGAAYPPEKMRSEDWWYAWVAMPGRFGPMGECLGFGPHADLTGLGYKIVCTEWNWNGSGYKRITPPPVVSHYLASGLGAAGFLQGMMRSGNEIGMATQSMLIGSGWDIASIKADPTGVKAPYFHPQGNVTTFYNLHHGSRMLQTDIAGVATYKQPFTAGWGSPVEKVAYADIATTATDKCVYVHVINRDMKRPCHLRIDLASIGAPSGAATLHMLNGSLEIGDLPPESLMLKETQSAVQPVKNIVETDAPAHSVCIIEIPMTSVDVK